MDEYTMSNKKIYQNFSLIEPSIPIFSRSWWLDAVCGPESWDVALIEREGEVLAAMPYYIKRKLGLTLFTLPPLTQALGPWLKPSISKHTLGQQKDLMYALIEQLPHFDYFAQNWHYTITNWLPFYWRGFEQTTRYTYILPDISDEKQLWNHLQGNIRRDIRKAENRFEHKVKDCLDLNDFLSLNQMTFERQNLSLPYTRDVVLHLDDACRNHKCRKIWIAEDANGIPHAGVYIVWDENSAYYLMGGGDPKLRSSGAASLCMWQAIRHASTVTHRFDFEGSMIESVERFFRGFGAIQVPYFRIIKKPSILLKLHDALKCIR